jgi:hypothetical protein
MGWAAKGTDAQKLRTIPWRLGKLLRPARHVVAMLITKATGMAKRLGINMRASAPCQDL